MVMLESAALQVQIIERSKDLGRKRRLDCRRKRSECDRHKHGLHGSNSVHVNVRRRCHAVDCDGRVSAQRSSGLPCANRPTADARTRVVTSSRSLRRVCRRRPEVFRAAAVDTHENRIANCGERCRESMRATIAFYLIVE